MKKRAGIVVEGVSKTYRSASGTVRHALRGVDLRVAPGEFVSLLGPSGCGKTTLLNIIGGLDTDYEGRVRFSRGEPEQRAAGRTADGDGAPSFARPVIGYVFQEARLLAWLTVRENVRLVLGGAGRGQAGRRLADDWLAKVGLSGYGDAYPGQLSIGMQQRVAVARALIVQPDLLIMDEPFSALDELTAHRMRAELMRLWEETGCTVVFVTHNPVEAVALADKVVVMTPSPGRVAAVLDVTARLPRPRNHDDASVWELSRHALALLAGAQREPETQNAGA